MDDKVGVRWGGYKLGVGIEGGANFLVDDGGEGGEERGVGGGGDRRWGCGGNGASVVGSEGK